MRLLYEKNMFSKGKKNEEIFKDIQEKVSSKKREKD